MSIDNYDDHKPQSVGVEMPDDELDKILDKLLYSHGLLEIDEDLTDKAKQSLLAWADKRVLGARIESVKGLYNSYLNDEFFDAEDFEIILSDLRNQGKEGK